LNERQKKAIDYIRKHGRISNREYREINNVPKITAYRDTNDLIKKKLVKKIGAGAQIHYILMRKL